MYGKYTAKSPCNQFLLLTMNFVYSRHYHFLLQKYTSVFILKLQNLTFKISANILIMVHPTYLTFRPKRVKHWLNTIYIPQLCGEYQLCFKFFPIPIRVSAQFVDHLMPRFRHDYATFISSPYILLWLSSERSSYCMTLSSHAGRDGILPEKLGEAQDLINPFSDEPIFRKAYLSHFNLYQQIEKQWNCLLDSLNLDHPLRKNYYFN